MIPVADVRYLPEEYADWPVEVQRDYLRERCARAWNSRDAALDRVAFLEERMHSLEQLVQTAAAFVNSPQRVS